MQENSNLHAGQYQPDLGANLAKFNMGHGIYAVQQANLLPAISMVGAATLDATTLAAATAGQAWTGQLQATDTDLLNWTAASLPRGMTLEVPGGANNSANGNRALLHWTPDLFAAQDNNGSGMAGVWRFSVQAGDGVAQVARSFEINVANFNQAPRILPMPLQLVSEGDTMSFTVLTADADRDAMRTSLVYTADTPAGVFFDGATGYFEWTPGQDVVNSATQNVRPYTFTFSTTAGPAHGAAQGLTSTQTVQVRVFDVNRVPRLTANNPVVLGRFAPGGEIMKLEDLSEVHHMISERVKKSWTQQWLKQGMQQGMREADADSCAVC